MVPRYLHLSLSASACCSGCPVRGVPHPCLPLPLLQGLRKPAAEAYQVVAATLQVEPARVVFVDDRQANVDGAVAEGMRAVRFQSAAQLEQELLSLGLSF